MEQFKVDSLIEEQFGLIQGVDMNRQQQRRIKKLTNEEIKQIKYDGMSKGINYTLKLVYEVMNKEFGFGEKRLNRLEEGILKKLEGM